VDGNEGIDGKAGGSLPDFEIFKSLEAHKFEESA
jgi:hypothetical protein